MASKLKSHKVDAKTFRAVKTYKRASGFWNPAMLEVTTECGERDPGIITKSWDRTDCLRCLRKPKAIRAKREKKGAGG